MDQGLKERLIGAVVLVAAGVVLIPWVLDGGREPSEPSATGLRLPAPDEPLPVRTETIRVGEPAAPVELAPAESESVAASADADGAGLPPVEEPPAVAAGETEAATEPVAQVAVAPPAVRKPEPARQTVPPAARAVAPPTASGGDWVVQLGSFGEEENARRLAQRVSAYGYKAGISSHRSGGRSMYRVRVGAFESRAQADATASSLAAHGVPAQVVAAD